MSTDNEKQDHPAPAAGGKKWRDFSSLQKMWISSVFTAVLTSVTTVTGSLLLQNQAQESSRQEQRQEAQINALSNAVTKLQNTYDDYQTKLDNITHFVYHMSNDPEKFAQESNDYLATKKDLGENLIHVMTAMKGYRNSSGSDWEQLLQSALLLDKQLNAFDRKVSTATKPFSAAEKEKIKLQDLPKWENDFRMLREDIFEAMQTLLQEVNHIRNPDAPANGDIKSLHDYNV